jgi:hypothetical protein
MSRLEHTDHSDLVVLHRTYEHLGREPGEDLIAICRHCAAAQYGFLIDEEGLGVTRWDLEQYPYDPTAEPGEACFRPGEDWPPSINEAELRLKSAAA